MRLRGIVRNALANRVGIAVIDKTGTTHLWRVAKGELLPEDMERLLWREHCRFFTIGGTVAVSAPWHMVEAPDTPEARRFASSFGEKPTAAYERPEGVPDPFSRAPKVAFDPWAFG